MVFQSFNLFNNMNVLENCLSGQLTVLKRNRQEAKEIALENLKKNWNGALCQRQTLSTFWWTKITGSYRSCLVNES